MSTDSMPSKSSPAQPAHPGPPLDRAEHERLAARFHHFADHDCPEEPLYQALSRIAAGDASLLDVMHDAPDEQRRPNLWLAALHDRLLSGAEHALAAYFPSCGGLRAPDAALSNIVRDFVRQEETLLRACIGSHSTQTNEIGRCAVLWPILQTLALRSNGRPLALLDVGCSAGLNLGVDVYRYELSSIDGDTVPASGDAPALVCELVGPKRPPRSTHAPQIATRLGIDPAPIDIDDEAAVRWLRACLWPSDRLRAQRFDQAVALARASRWPVRHEADCSAAIGPWLDSLPAGFQPVIFNSWVLTYFERAALQHHIQTVTGLVRTRGALWLSAEPASLSIGEARVPPPVHPETASGTLWTLCHATASGLAFETMARSHPHGRWMEWLVDEAGG